MTERGRRNVSLGKFGGIQRRWLVNMVSWVLVLVVACVVVASMAVAGYYYSNIKSGMEAKAKTSSDFFSNYINLSYNDYYQSCVKLTQDFEDKNTMELQFSDRSLHDVSRLMQVLESKDIVAGVSVSMAKTDEKTDVVSVVTVTLQPQSASAAGAAEEN